jgi:hypothetical protein
MEPDQRACVMVNHDWPFVHTATTRPRSKASLTRAPGRAARTRLLADELKGTTTIRRPTRIAALLRRTLQGSPQTVVEPSAATRKIHVERQKRRSATSSFFSSGGGRGARLAGVSVSGGASACTAKRRIVSTTAGLRSMLHKCFLGVAQLYHAVRRWEQQECRVSVAIV